MCISWNNKKCFDTIHARCKHEIPPKVLAESSSVPLNFIGKTLCLVCDVFNVHKFRVCKFDVVRPVVFRFGLFQMFNTVEADYYDHFGTRAF